jgi:CBS domain-containing protein
MQVLPGASSRGIWSVRDLRATGVNLLTLARAARQQSSRNQHFREASLTLIQALQRRPAVTTPETTLRSAAKQMAKERTSVLPVMAHGRMVGMLSAFDLVARGIADSLDPDQRTVRAVMRPDPPTCGLEAGVRDVRRQMRELRMPVLPVVEANGELVGLVDLFDVENAGDDGMAAGPEPEMVKRVRGEAL